MNIQAHIDEIDWYHEFDFGRGLKARSTAPDVAWHRQVWRFLEQQLNGVDFRDKTVLDVGAWDGYWSFLAERRGARYVLASDDLTQNWSDGRGIHLAKELLGSGVDINQGVSVYRLGMLKRTFDIVMCFGVYYHLFDPLYAFAHIRHCCHDSTLVLLDGDVGRSGMRPDEVRYRFGDSTLSAFVPSCSALESLLRVSYLQVQSQVWLRPRRFLHKDGTAIQQLRYLLNKLSIDRAFTVCTPFRGANELHSYEPPFGLGVYDDRFVKQHPRSDAGSEVRGLQASLFDKGSGKAG
jgi:tRNA (mo5U34)-methyltransferase